MIHKQPWEINKLHLSQFYSIPIVSTFFNRYTHKIPISDKKFIVVYQPLPQPVELTLCQDRLNRHKVCLRGRQMHPVFRYYYPSNETPYGGL